MNQELHPICHKLLANDVINWVDGKIVKKLCLKARWSVEGLLTGKTTFHGKSSAAAVLMAKYECGGKFVRYPRQPRHDQHHL